MPSETNPSPTASAISAPPPPLTEMEALRKVGWIQPLDYLMLFLTIMCWLTLIAWKVFGQPTPWNVLSCVVTAFGLVQIWIVMLLFRCSHFVLLIQGHMHDLPYAAARIVMSAHSGGGGIAPNPAPRRNNS